MFTDINRIAELAKEDPKRQFSSMAHLITVAKLYEAFRGLRKNASAGIDGVTATNTRRTRKRISDSSTSGSKKASIGHNHCDVSIFRKKTGNRGRSRFPSSRIRSFRKRRLTC